LVSKLTGAFLGFGLARYGAFSAELDVNYVSATSTKELGGNIFTLSRSLKLDTSLFRISPGFGYEVFRGDVGAVPATSMRGSVSPTPTRAPHSPSREPTSPA
jgi:hypothetical protein